jgi:hypothetical protein
MGAGLNVTATVLVVVLVLFTIALSIFSRRFTRTTADFYLAGRKVGSFSNASAISGDYLSAIRARRRVVRRGLRGRLHGRRALPRLGASPLR